MATGHTPSRKHPEYWGGNIPWMNVGDARPFHGRVIHGTSETTNPLGIENSAAVVLPEGTVCLSRTGSIGYAVILGRPMATSQGFVNWICGPELLPQFLQRIFVAEQTFLHEISEGMAHTTIYFPEVKAFHVCIPCVAEQRRIVAEIEKQFSRLDEAVANLKRVKANLKRYSAAVLNAAVGGCLIPTEAEVANAEGRSFETGQQLLRRIQGATEPRAHAKRGRTIPIDGVTTARHEFPQGWAEGTFGDLCRVQGGYAFKSADYVTSGVPLARISNLVNGAVQFDDDTVFLTENFLARFGDFRLEKGDVLIALSGATMGKMATYTKDVPALLNQRVRRFRPTVSSLTAPGYIALLAAHAGRKVLAEAYGAAQPNISPIEIEAMPVGVPPLAEQSRIVAAVERILSNVREVEVQVDANLERARALRQAVLASGFSNSSKAVPSQL